MEAIGPAYFGINLINSRFHCKSSSMCLLDYSNLGVLPNTGLYF